MSRCMRAFSLRDAGLRHAGLAVARSVLQVLAWDQLSNHAQCVGYS